LSERYVLDSFALLAYLEEEAGAAEVQAILRACETTAEAWLSIVNFGEVVYITEREQGLQAAQRVIAIIDQLPLRVAAADRSRTFAAAHVKARGALSYADAFAVALALEIEGKVVTGDPEFAKAEDLVPVRWIGSETPDSL
jgi:PIN domain nuclease of toxin-antitoxin system